MISHIYLDDLFVSWERIKPQYAAPYSPPPIMKLKMPDKNHPEHVVLVRWSKSDVEEFEFQVVY